MKAQLREALAKVEEAQNRVERPATLEEAGELELKLAEALEEVRRRRIELEKEPKKD